MQIESGALLHLFDTLVLPGEKELPTKVISKTIVETKLEELEVPKLEQPKMESPIKVVSKKLTMIFNLTPSADEEDLLSKILTAIKIQPDQTGRIISNNNSEVLLNMDESNGIILSWGASLTSGEKYVITKKDNLKIIESDSLSVIKMDQNLKAKLWNCLKATFTL